MPENNNSSDNNSAGDPSAPEKRCASCGRPESAAGKLIKMPNDMNVCQDCMKRSVEMLGNMWGDMDSMFGMKEPEPEKKKKNPVKMRMKIRSLNFLKISDLFLSLMRSRLCLMNM